jgi:hypothetical protein
MGLQASRAAIPVGPFVQAGQWNRRRIDEPQYLLAVASSEQEAIALSCATASAKIALGRRRFASDKVDRRLNRNHWCKRRCHGKR